MPKTKHYAKAPNGQVFHRTSQSRVYSHMVIGRRSKETALFYANSGAARDQDGRNWDYAQSKVLGDLNWYEFESEASRQQDRAIVAMGREKYLDQRQAERVAKVEATDFSQWSDLGWASRIDLAEKNEMAHASKPYWAEVRILEAKII